MWCVTFPAGPWHTNCYLVAAQQPAGPTECVVIDPGVGATDQVNWLVNEHDLTIGGILLTHGHIDHVYAAETLCAEHDAAVWIHPDDEQLLTDPLAGLGPDAAALLESFHGSTTLTPPQRLVHLGHGDEVEMAAGLRFGVRHAPGHTRGSVLLSLEAEQTGSTPVTFTGDVVFAGSVGRTDLPGGDHDTLLRSISDQVLTLPADSALLPGHGPATTLAQERDNNPFFP